MHTRSPKDLAAPREWLERPSAFPRIQSEAVARVLSSDLADDERVVAESLRALREEIAEVSARIDELLHAGLDLSRKKLDVVCSPGSGELVDQLAAPPEADALRMLARRIEVVYGEPVCAVRSSR